MAKAQILLVEDEEAIQELVRYNLIKEGYSLQTAASGEEALEKMRGPLPDLMLLDLMLPGLDGLDLCKRLKSEARTRHLPIIMLTAKSGEADIVAGLEVGADDYVTKPFSPRVLLARVRAVLRRKAKEITDEATVLKVHDLVIDPARHQVLYKNKPLSLTFTEYRLLHLLARRPGLVLSREQIVESLHGDSGLITDRAVDVQIVGLRKKLGPAEKYIETVRGVGYRFQE